MSNVLPPVFELTNITLDDISKAIDRKSNSGASSVDDIRSLMVRACKTELLPVLCYLCNMSILQKCYPDIWKIAQVTVLFKQGSTTEANNYRPISVLPSFGKVSERVVQTQCFHYLESNLLSEHQFGFRANRSTGTCLLDFLHNVYTSIDNGMGCGVLYLDLAKAFDCFEHETLLCKLKSLGFKSCLVNWFRSYLSNRIQSTVVNGVPSSTGEAVFGVPQGSILGISI